jgi:hypothetical protein
MFNSIEQYVEQTRDRAKNDSGLTRNDKMWTNDERQSNDDFSIEGKDACENLPLNTVDAMKKKLQIYWELLITVQFITF